ncbi:MAG: hypothetical protein ABUL58_06250 [Steroidobacter sp.]
MAWYDYIDMGLPPIFNPKVTPDPAVAERLEEKLQQAMREFKPLHLRQRPDPVPVLIAAATRRTG